MGLSLDEKTLIQALSRPQPVLPLRPGLPARQTHDYRCNGVTSLYWNAHPTPFVWTKEPADVIKKAIRRPVH